MPDAGVLAPIPFEHLLYLLPEGIMTLGILVLLALTVMTHKKRPEENDALMLVSLGVVVMSLLALSWLFYVQMPVFQQPQRLVYDSLSADLFGYLMRALLLLGCGMTIVLSSNFLQQRTRILGDYYTLLLGATLGGMFLASANDLITVFVGLETLSITSYILAGYLRKTARSAEASLKYLIYGGMGTAVFLFGLSLVYGLSGATNFQAIAGVLHTFQGIGHPTLLLMMILTLAALAFKLSLAPFHMWTPDVYEGAPTPVSAFLSVVSKTAAFAVTIRLLIALFSGFSHWVALLGLLAVVSMTLGNVVALKQTNIKRLLAYSTIAHAGYMLLGLMLGTSFSLGSLVYYLITYLFMNLGAFACAIQFSNMAHTDEIAAYQGLVQKRPALVFAFSICLLSLAGIPITAGFFAKFFLFQALAFSGTEFLWLVIVAMLNSAVSMAYYINLIRLMVVKEPSPELQALTPGAGTSWALSTALAVSVVVTLVLGVFASPFLQFSALTIEQLAYARGHVVSHAR